MSCPICGDRGVVRVRYRDGSPDDFGVCRCAAGERLRQLRRAAQVTPLWQAWAARERVSPDAMVMAEDVLDEEELARIPRAESAPQASSSIAAAMQTQKARL